MSLPAMRCRINSRQPNSAVVHALTRSTHFGELVDQPIQRHRVVPYANTGGVKETLHKPRHSYLAAATIIALAESLGLDVIAEGTETADQCRVLARLGCHVYQGYYFGKPAPAAEFARRNGASSPTAS